MAKSVPQSPVKKINDNKNKLKHKKPKPKNLKPVAASELANKPAPKPAQKPASKPVSNSALTNGLKSAQKAAPKPANKLAAQKPTPKPAQKPTPKPANKIADQKPTSKPAPKSSPKPEPKVKEASEVKAKIEDKVNVDIITKHGAKYPVLKNRELFNKFMSVPMTNNQKGRLRSLVKDNLKGTADSELPDVINNKIQSTIKASKTLSEAELRRVRILYNMLKLSLDKRSSQKEDKKKSRNKIRKEKRKKGAKKEVNDEDASDVDDKEEEVEDKPKVVKEKPAVDAKKDVKDKVKGPKRYVAFVGNLALDIDKERLMEHFSEISDFIVDVRIPQPAEGKKACIAYLELKNESSYELALSKHHTMFENRRINVLYSTQQNSKVSKAEAKGKTAKLIALQKSGQLSGSIPMNKKRSQRRKKAKVAQKKLEQS